MTKVKNPSIAKNHIYLEYFQMEQLNLFLLFQKIILQNLLHEMIMQSLFTLMDIQQ